MKQILIILLTGLLLINTSYTSADDFEGCYARLKNDTLFAGNSFIERQWLWNNGNLTPVRLINKSVYPNRITEMTGIARDSIHPLSAELKINQMKETTVSHAMLQAEIISDYGGYKKKTIISIYHGTPAIRMQYAFLVANDTDAPPGLQEFVIDRFSLPSLHYTIKTVEFFDRTDVMNNLVNEETFLPFPTTIRKRGNLMMAESNDGHDSFYFLKEAPCSFVQLNYAGFDFEVKGRQIAVAGSGLADTDLVPGEWLPAYSVVLGIATGDYPVEYSLRAYQKNLRNHDDRRDEMIMMNTWGDRNRDASIGQEFCLREIDACVKYGITHFQIDDGWQTGFSTNSANPGGNLWDRWTVKDWQPASEKFPDGFAVVVNYARAHHVELGLWFHPSNANSYENWKQDATIIAGLYRDYGIKYFKIDGINLPDKASEINLRKFFDYALVLTGNEVVFNVDATANSRGGYHFLNKYGNIFLENRYTDWGKYYPHWTLRNLWQLSAFVPPELLQIEFLNKWRNADKYPAGDSLAPVFIPVEYEFATTMAGQPLAWFEGSNLPSAAEKLIPVIKAYKTVWNDFHAGTILPIGSMPDGHSWTGFQSIGAGHGYFLIYREKNGEGRHTFQTYLKPDQKISLVKICGSGMDMEADIESGRDLFFSLPTEFSFALYRYDIVK